MSCPGRNRAAFPSCSRIEGTNDWIKSCRWSDCHYEVAHTVHTRFLMLAKSSSGSGLDHTQQFDTL